MKAYIFQAAVICVASAIIGGISYALHPAAPALYLNSAPPAEGETTLPIVLEKWGVENVLWIDARPEEKFAAGHWPNAIPLNDQVWTESLWQNSEAILGSDLPIVIYCGSEACEASKKVAERLRQEVGVPEVYFLRGGWRELKGLLAK